MIDSRRPQYDRLWRAYYPLSAHLSWNLSCLFPSHCV